MWRMDLELKLGYKSVMLDVMVPASGGIGLTQIRCPPQRKLLHTVDKRNRYTAFESPNSLTKSSTNTVKLLLSINAVGIELSVWTA